MTIWKFEGKDAIKITGKETTLISECSLPAEEITDLRAFIETADAAILRGDYLEAMKRYRVMLSNGVEDRLLLQRVIEFKWFIRLLGKDKYMLLLLLEDFLSGIRQRHENRKKNAGAYLNG